jgi:hypothetical protein
VAVTVPVRLAAGLALAAIGGFVAARPGVSAQRAGEGLLVVGIVVANPSLFATAFSLLIAVVPLWRSAGR